ncbi:MAG TPA: membrane protein insertion efficiency factor YidD [Gallionella sp.]|nr:membrane protein insertion efficiency factor YidD [Gallionella sp.]
MRKFVIKLIHAYQYLISPLGPPTCRFIPSCSQYACDAFAKHGFIKGGWLSIKRLLRCNPCNPGGYDPAP